MTWLSFYIAYSFGMVTGFALIAIGAAFSKKKRAP